MEKRKQDAQLAAPWDFQKLQSVLALKNKFTQATNAFAELPGPRLLSVATYNVHMWMDPFDNEGEPLTEETDSVDRILKVIEQADADVLLLQEFAPSDFHFNNRLVRAGKAIPALQAMGYVKSVFCNIVPSWLESPVGNAIFVKADVLDAEFCENGFKICKGLSEEIRTMKKAKIVSRVQGIHEGQRETRCFASIRLRISNRVFIVVTTHLDIANEGQRLSQLKEILDHVAEQIRLATLDNITLRERNVLNRDYPFAEPVVIIAGDFNTVDPEDIDAVADEREREKLMEMLNVVNQGRGQIEFCDLIKDPEQGVCAYITQKDHHASAANPEGDLPETKPYRYHSVRVPGHTNWNLTKIDHVFVGQPSEGLRLEVRGTIHPEPASDHLLVLVSIPGESMRVPYNYERLENPSEEAVRRLGQPLDLKSALAQGAGMQDVYEVDEALGLTYYYPQVFCPSLGMTARQSKFLVFGPALLPKAFGAWNQPSYFPSGEAKIIQNSTRIDRRASEESQQICVAFFDIMGRDEDWTDVVLFAGPFMSGVSDQVANSLIKSQKTELFVTTVRAVNAILQRELGASVRVLRNKHPSLTALSVYHESAVLLDGEPVQWQILDEDVAYELLQLREALRSDQRRSVYTGYLPVTPHFNEKFITTKYRLTLTKDLNQKLNRYTYLFPCKISVEDAIANEANIGTLDQFQATYFDFYARTISRSLGTNNNVPDLVELVREIAEKVRRSAAQTTLAGQTAVLKHTERMFSHWFAAFALVGHDDDVFQVSSGSVLYLNSTHLSRYSASYNRTVNHGSDFDAGPWLLKFDNPLELLHLFVSRKASAIVENYNVGEVFFYENAQSGSGRKFYREVDFESDAFTQSVEHLMGWIQLDYLQQYMMDNAVSVVQPLLFSESPEYIANTEREITLKTPLHTVSFPKTGPQTFDYTIGATWNNVIYTEGLKVCPVHRYYVIPPLQRVNQNYVGYADCVDDALDVDPRGDLKRVARKHLIHTKAAKNNDPPRRISWKAFRYLSESDTTRAHLDRLELKLERVFETPRKDKWLPDFPEGIADVLAKLVGSPKQTAGAILKLATSPTHIPALLQTMSAKERRPLYHRYVMAELEGDRKVLDGILKSLRGHVEFSSALGPSQA